jgi:hypothetical protein
LIHCELHKPVSLEIRIQNHLPIPFTDCLVTVKFKKLNKNCPFVPSKNLAFRKTLTPPAADSASTSSIYNLERIMVPQKMHAAYNNTTGTDELVEKINNISLTPGKNSLTFEINVRHPTVKLIFKNKNTGET